MSTQTQLYLISFISNPLDTRWPLSRLQRPTVSTGIRIPFCADYVFISVFSSSRWILVASQFFFSSRYRIPTPTCTVNAGIKTYVEQVERVGLRNELVFAIYLSAQAATREARKPGNSRMSLHLDLAQFLYLSVSVSVLNRTALSIYELVLLASKLVFFRCEGDSIPIAKKVAPPSRFATQKTSSDISE
ncbi:hypothetical protein LENED_012217 [Lentinula edodes]|uniref:Uncharacterized protein n=1 Tax=Lentinula edodes TaxID=5353 RepID=A0A1Q3ES36_LENED|nr:hypothetical protein LENED_012217 [Lentinula edodes]